MTNRLVSIITLTYNRRNILGKSIKSALEQTYTNFELLILDDGSDDGTSEFMQTFSDSRISYKYLNHSGNVAALRNKGMKLAKGEYIAFLDSDDLWSPNKLEVQVNCLEDNPETGITFCGTKRWDSYGNIKENHFNHLEYDSVPQNLFNDFIVNKFIVVPSACLFRKSVLNQSGYSNENLITGDTEFISRILINELAIVDKDAYVEMTQNGDNMTNYIQKDSYHEYQYMLDYNFERNLISQPIYTKMSARMSYLLAKQLLVENKLKESRKVFGKTIRMNKLNYKAWFYYLKSYL